MGVEKFLEGGGDKKAMRLDTVMSPYLPPPRSSPGSPPEISPQVRRGGCGSAPSALISTC